MKEKFLLTLKKLIWDCFLVWFGLVWFYGTSIIVGNFMPNLFLYK